MSPKPVELGPETVPLSLRDTELCAEALVLVEAFVEAGALAAGHPPRRREVLERAIAFGDDRVEIRRRPFVAGRVRHAHRPPALRCSLAESSRSRDATRGPVSSGP